MLKIFQQTISKPVTFKGTGLHTGKNSTLTIYPGKSDQGIVFKRIDLSDRNQIQANYKNVSSATLCTTLENEFGTKVSTVEHLMAALYVADIDNAVVEIDSEEVPIMDGSASKFLNDIQKQGLKELSKKRKYLNISKKLELIDGERKISIEKSNSTFNVEFKLNYKNNIIGNQSNKVNFNENDLHDVISSRTFCLFEDIEKIKKMGLAKGGSLDNALVIDKDKILNEEGLRNEKEFVNHKILDLAGDFLLSGFRILGTVKCNQGGHELTNMFLRKLLKISTAFEISELKEIVVSQKIRSNQSIKIAVNA